MPVVTVVGNLVIAERLSLAVGGLTAAILIAALTFAAHRWIEIPGMRIAFEQKMTTSEHLLPTVAVV